MDSNKAIWAALIVCGAALVTARQSAAGDIEAALANKNVQAFLALIRRFESGGDYSVIYGGQRFEGFSAHPNRRIPFRDPRTDRTNYSTAAGAYQITFPTWLTIQAAAFLPDFSPSSQDAGAVWLLKLRGALGFIIAGDIDNALRVASKTWASLPYTESKQAHISATLAVAVYKSNGGTTA